MDRRLDVNVDMEEGVQDQGTASNFPKLKLKIPTSYLNVSLNADKDMQAQGTKSNYSSETNGDSIQSGLKIHIDGLDMNVDMEEGVLAQGTSSNFPKINSRNPHIGRPVTCSRNPYIVPVPLSGQLALDLEKHMQAQGMFKPKQPEKHKEPEKPTVPCIPKPANIFKDYDLYLASKNGNRNAFIRILHRILTTDHLSSWGEILSRVSPVGNTFLHVAAVHGNISVANCIAANDPSVLLVKNLNGDTTLHLVAKAGDGSMLQDLVLSHHDYILDDSQIETEDENTLLRIKNKKGNTALHEALINGREFIAQYLINEDPELSYYPNRKGEHGMYLAAEAGFANCVSSFLEFSTDHDRIDELFKIKSPIKAAIKNKKLDVLKLMLDSDPRFIKLEDNQGRTPLHYAASSGYVKVVRDLLERHASGVTQSDNSGLFPIHLAAIKGHVHIISLLLEFCPDPEELLDGNCRNILHLAAMNGKLNIVKYILHNPKLEKLKNMSDITENTPLHLATQHWHPEIVSALTWDKRVNIKLTNDKGMTALDVAVDLMDNDPPFSQLLTWAALKAVGTPRTKSKKRQGSLYSSENYKERINTLLLVSALVATMTFAAGFTLPGGYSSSDIDKGMAIMLRKKAFHVFIFCDTIAMYSSIVVVVSLIWAQLCDLRLLLNAMTFAQPLLVMALAMMSMAFTAGIFLVVRDLHWLSIAILVLGLTFLAVLLVIMVPFCMPLASSNTIIRYIYYYPFWLLILVSRTKSPDKKDV